MNIQAVEKITGLSARQIREYEKMGLLPIIARTSSGYRDYTAANIERLTFIKRARAVDFSLEEIRTLLALQDNPHRNNVEVKALTAQHIANLNKKIAQMQTMKDSLALWHDNCRGDGSAKCEILDQLSFSKNSIISN